MSTIQQDIDQIKANLAASKEGDGLDLVQSLQNDDRIIIHGNIPDKLVGISYSKFLEIVGSNGLTFEEEMDAQNPPQPTGFTLIKQAGITKFKVGSAAKSNNYGDLDGKPNFATAQDVTDAFVSANDYTETQVDASRAYYDTFQYKEGSANDLTGFLVESDYSVTKTTNGQYYFIKDINITDTVEGSRVFALQSNQFFNLAVPDIETATFKAWNIALDNPVESPKYKVYSEDAQTNVVDTGIYKFDLWIRKSSGANTSGRFVEIDGYWVDKRTNLNQSTIQIGDKIEGDYNGTDRHIVANVTALPYTTETNLEILVDGRAWT